MTYKIRNTIVLGAVLGTFILIWLGVWWWWQPRQITKITKEIKAINKELEDLPGLTEEVQQLTLRYQEVKRRYDSRSKEIPQYDISSQTYGYISNGIDEAGFLKFDMIFIGTHEKENESYNAYRLEQGEGQFENLFKFIYYIENGKRLYKISTLRISNIERIDEETKEVTSFVTFDMEIHAYFVKNIPELSTSLAAKSLTMIPSPSDPFRSIVTQIIATEAPYGEIDADKLEVKAVLPGKAIVLYEGALTVLHLGDKVWRGNVTRISPIESSVEFVLNEGGVTRKLVKKIYFERKMMMR